MIFIAVALGEALLRILQVGRERTRTQLGNPFGGLGDQHLCEQNHFAALMAMALPMLVAMWAGRPCRRASEGNRCEHPRHADAKLARRIAWSLAIALTLAALLFARSRAGIGCGLAAFAAASLGLVWSTASRGIRVALAATALCAFGLAAYVGLTPILERFAPDALSIGYEGRVRAAAATVQGALEFLPFGSGLGTFADVFRRYQSEGLTGFFDHAHNDYAEVFLELGVAGVAIVLLAAIAYLARWKVWAPVFALARLLAGGRGLALLRSQCTACSISTPFTRTRLLRFSRGLLPRSTTSLLAGSRASSAALPCGVRASRKGPRTPLR